MGATIGTRLMIWWKGELVGEDEFSNRYFKERNGRRRWVVYNGEPEASKVPSDYEVRFHVGDREETVPLTVLPDPRWNVTEAGYAAQERFLAQAGDVLEEMHQGLNQLRDARTQVEELVSRTAEHAEADTVAAAAGALNDGITEWEAELAQPKQKTFQDVINFENKLNAEFASLIGSIDGTPPPVIEGARDRLADLLAEWSTHRSTMNDLFRRLEAFNQLVQDLAIPPIVVKRALPRVISRARSPSG